ncbi:MAG: hypothetical protein H0U78_04270 [Rickettsiaceae bacterium]|jgi:hypothetical protein|nr:hypothetical protein [Rickettsiaceae bacterium]
MKKRIKTMLSKGVEGFLYVQKPISIVMMVLFFSLLILGAIKKYGGDYESSVEYKQKYIMEKQEVSNE